MHTVKASISAQIPYQLVVFCPLQVLKAKMVQLHAEKVTGEDYYKTALAGLHVTCQELFSDSARAIGWVQAAVEGWARRAVVVPAQVRCSEGIYPSCASPGVLYVCAEARGPRACCCAVDGSCSERLGDSCFVMADTELECPVVSHVHACMHACMHATASSRLPAATFRPTVSRQSDPVGVLPGACNSPE